MSDYADSIGQDMGQGNFKILTMDKDFNDFWDAYQPDENRFPRRRAATFRAWNGRTPAARKAMLAKVKAEGAPKWKNPYFYVMDFPEPEPFDWNGHALETGRQYVTAKWNGKWGTYTIEDVRDFNLETKKIITMALKYKLEAPFESISGVVSRKRFADGHVESIIATKKGTLYTRKWYPPATNTGSSPKNNPTKK